MKLKKVLVVGAGPAGMMAAIRAGELGCEVELLEKNSSPGKKILLSGKGRCNLTNTCDLDSFIKRFSGNGQFLRDAFKKFFHQDLISFFQNRGLKITVGRQMRAFPATLLADSVLGVLKAELAKNKVRVLYNSAVRDIYLRGNSVSAVSLRDGRRIAVDKIILATGGVSYPFTGSTGEGIKLASRLGHRIAPLLPGLVPLETKQGYPRLLSNLILKNIRIIFSDGKRQIISAPGELLFTEFGIAGPLVLSLSGQITDWLSAGAQVCARIDLKPALSLQQLDARLIREFQASPKEALRKVLENLLPKRMVKVFAALAEIPAEQKVSHITCEQRKRIAGLLKGLPLEISRARPIEEAMVTRGGVSLKDINPRTLESRLVKGLYFAGEMIDVDADTGGFNLQAAFSTGYLAGESAAS